MVLLVALVLKLPLLISHVNLGRRFGYVWSDQVFVVEDLTLAC